MVIYFRKRVGLYLYINRGDSMKSNIKKAKVGCIISLIIIFIMAVYILISIINHKTIPSSIITVFLCSISIFFINLHVYSNQKKNNDIR